METVGILCERVRVEEKQIIAALLREGLPAVPVPPLDLPVTIGADSDAAATDSIAAQFPLLIDRCPERSTSSHLLSLLAESGGVVLGAGLASAGTRLDVARSFAEAAIARPRTVFVGSEKAGLAALKQFGYPSTLMPMTLSKRPLPIFDEDIAEAVLEHRNMLGSATVRSIVIQAGSPSVAEVLDVMVVDGAVVATSVAGKPALRHEDALRLAIRAAEVLNAQIVAIRIAQVATGLVVWDVDPAPEFRKFIQLGPLSVAEAIGNLAANLHPAESMVIGGNRGTSGLEHSSLQESTRGLVISA